MLIPSVRRQLALIPSVRRQLALIPSVRRQLALIPSVRRQLAPPGHAAQPQQLPEVLASAPGSLGARVSDVPVRTQNSHSCPSGSAAQNLSPTA